jgi:hypothetical protein
MATFTQTGKTIPLADYAGQMTVTAEALDVLDAAFCGFSVISISTTTPPAHTEGNRYLIPSGASAPWDTHADDLTISHNGAWVYLTPNEGWQIKLDSSTARYRYDGSAWVESSFEAGTISTGLTASVTQTQGQQPLVSTLNKVTTVANANDVVTLQAAQAATMVLVSNHGANTLQVFPASGDYIDDGAVDASTTIAADDRKLFWAVSDSIWVSMTGSA